MQSNFATKLKVQHPLQQNGFTLLELIVVIVIVAILFTYTTLAIRGNAPEDAIITQRLLSAATRLKTPSKKRLDVSSV